MTVASPEVVVIGAGVAGLTCARMLIGHGVMTTVVEARQRIGGRVYTFRGVEGRAIELGAQVVHGPYARTWDVIREGGLRTASLEQRPPRLLLEVDGRGLDIDQARASGVAEPWRVERVLARLNAPDWSVRHALDALGIGGATRSIAEAWLTQYWGADPETLSVTGMRQIREAWQAGLGDFFVLDGYDRVVETLARDVPVSLGSPVRTIHWSPGNVVVESETGAWEGSAAVITVPPTVVATDRLRFDPPLPEGKADAARAIRLGDAIGVICRLTIAPPESIVLLLAGGGGLWRLDAESQYLVGWVKGAAAEQLRRSASDRKSILERVGRFFPFLTTSAIEEVISIDWGVDPYALGAYSYPAVGASGAQAIWATSVISTLFFAGEATCEAQHPAMVHGAIESGMRAAREILAMAG
jgi:monoamine oxidase